MITRIALLGAIVAVLVTGLVLGPRVLEVGGELPAAGEGPYLVCPGAIAGGGFQGRMGLYADEPGTGRVTVVGSEGASSALELVGLGGTTVLVGDLAELGVTPLYLEAGGNLAAATLSTAGEAAAVSPCQRAQVGPLAVLGLATNGNENAALVLVNPFAQPASLRLELVSELGTDTPSDLETIRLPSFTHIEVPLARILGGREAVSVVVETISGLVTVAGVRGGETDVAVAEAVEGATDWYFPLFAQALSADLHLRSVADIGGDFRIDRIDTTGTVEAAVEGAIDPGQQIVVSLEELGASEGGLVVVATEPLVAALVLDTGNTRAITPGAVPGSRWVLPVTATRAEGQNLLWIFNPSDGPLTAAVTPVEDASTVAPVEVAPGSTVEITLPDLGGGGVLVETDGLMVVALGVVNGEAIGITMATLLE